MQKYRICLQYFKGVAILEKVHMKSKWLYNSSTAAFNLVESKAAIDECSPCS